MISNSLFCGRSAHFTRGNGFVIDWKGFCPVEFYFWFLAIHKHMRIGDFTTMTSVLRLLDLWCDWTKVTNTEDCVDNAVQLWCIFWTSSYELHIIQTPNESSTNFSNKNFLYATLDSWVTGTYILLLPDWQTDWQRTVYKVAPVARRTCISLVSCT